MIQTLEMKQNDETLAILGYCEYCKDAVLEDEEYRETRSGKVYHQFCWEQKTGHRKELKF